MNGGITVDGNKKIAHFSLNVPVKIQVAPFHEVHE